MEEETKLETPEEKAVPSPCRGDGSSVSYDRAKGKAFLQKSFPSFYGVQPVEDTKHPKQETTRYVWGLWQALPEQTVVV